MLRFKGKSLAMFVLAWSGIIAGNVFGDEKEVPARDRLGDPLPLGAVARLGTARLRGCGDIYRMAFSHDGKWLATLDERGVRIWSVATGKELAYVASRYENYFAQRINNGLCGVTFSTDGKTLVCFGKSEEGPEISLYNLSALSEKLTTPTVLTEPRLAITYQGLNAALLAFLPDGKTLLSADIRGQVHLWDTASGQELRTFATDFSIPCRYALSPDGKTLAVGETSSLALWETATGKKIGEMPGWSPFVTALAFSPDSKRLAAGIRDSDVIRLFDVATRKEIHSFADPKEPERSRHFGRIAEGLAFVADGKTLVSLGSEGDDTIRIWDVESGKLRRSIRGSRGDGGALALSPDGRIAAVAGGNGAIRLWELAAAKELHSGQRQGRVLAVAASPDDRRVAVGSYDGVVRLYDCGSGAEAHVFATQRSAIRDLAFAPDGKALLVLPAYHPAKLWDVSSGKELRSFAGVASGVDNVVRYAAFSADGRRLALVSPEPANGEHSPGPSEARTARSTAIQIVDPASGKVVRRWGEKQWIKCMAFSPDGRKLAGGGSERGIHLWDAASGEKLWTVSQISACFSIAFAPDGDSVAMGDSRGGVNIASAADGRTVCFWPGADGGSVVRALAFSPDGRLLAATEGENGDILLLETAAFAATTVRRLNGHKGAVWSLAFSPDGRKLISGGDDATALVWDMTGRAFANKPAVALSDADLENLWNDLGGADGAKGYGAVWALVRSGKQGVAFLQARLSQAPDGQTVSRLIDQLDDDAFAVREKASAALARMNRSIQTPLKDALAKMPSAEARRRMQAILKELSDKGDPRLCGLRSVAALEYADTPQARSLLKHLAGKDPAEEIRCAARSALKRLENAASIP